jgi:hypothetical protein
MVIEEHGASKQLIRFRVWPRVSAMAKVLPALLIVLVIDALLSHNLPAAALLGGVTVLFALRVTWECSTSLSTAIMPFERGGMDTSMPFCLTEIGDGKALESEERIGRSEYGQARNQVATKSYD